MTVEEVDYVFDVTCTCLSALRLDTLLAMYLMLRHSRIGDPAVLDYVVTIMRRMLTKVKRLSDACDRLHMSRRHVVEFIRVNAMILDHELARDDVSAHRASSLLLLIRTCYRLLKYLSDVLEEHLVGLIEMSVSAARAYNH